MFLRKFDFLSPPITLYYKGDQSHSSIFAGILTILVYLICLYFNVLYAIRYIKRINPQVCYYNRYVEDTGEFPLNASAMFNYIQIIDSHNNLPDIIDFDLINIIGIAETINLYQQDNDLSKYNHWIYGPCNKSTDLEGLEEIIRFDRFTGAACIRKYYNKEDKKYYNINEQNFKWPIISHGYLHPNRKIYGIIVEKCRNTTLQLLGDGKICKSKEEIIEYTKVKSIKLQLIDQYIDILDYKNPHRKYFYSISNGFFEESFTTNHLNFNPSKIISDEGIFTENKKETLSYIFDLNEKTTSSSGDSGIYVAFYFWLQKRMYYFERVYQKFQEVLSDVGGLCSIVLTIAELINLVVNQYIILFDIKDYMKEIENSKEFNKNIFRIKDNNIIKLFPPKKTNQNEKDKEKEKVLSKENENEDNSNKVRILKGGIDIYSKKDNIIKKKKIKKAHFSINEKNSLNKKKSPKYSTSHKNTKGILKSKTEQSNYCLKDLNKAQTFIETIVSKDTRIQKSKYEKLNFCHYLAYLIPFTKNHPYIKIYSDFRIKMISEENLIINNLNIDKLLKKSKDENNSFNQDLDTPRTNLNND